MKVRRTDLVQLDAADKTSEGYIDTFGNITRTGVFTYLKEDGSKQYELRLPEHVFNEDSLKTFDGQPLSLNHPQENFTPHSFKNKVVGFVMDPKKADDNTHVRARIRIMDADAIRAVEGGIKELSNGYYADLIPVEGGYFKRDDFNGGEPVRVDYIQTNIRGNHTALVARGRAGPTARLDSMGNQAEEDMEELKAAQDKVAELEGQVKSRKDAEDTLKGENELLKAEVAKLQSELKAHADKAEAERLAKRASDLAVYAKVDAAELAKLDEASMLRETLKKLSPSIKSDEWSLEQLSGAVEVAIAFEKSRVDSASQAAQAAKAARTDSGSNDNRNASETAFQKMKQQMLQAWK